MNNRPYYSVPLAHACVPRIVKELTPWRQVDKPTNYDLPRTTKTVDYEQDPHKALPANRVKTSVDLRQDLHRKALFSGVR
jgi:hypothetical protein